MRGITPAQLRKIHMCAREGGLDNDLLHCHVAALTGKGSLKELTIHEAVTVIDSLSGKGFLPAQERATMKQMYYIEGLMKELGWVDGEGKPDMKRLDGMCRKYAGADSHKWLTKAGAHNIIEALKNMQKHSTPDRMAE